MTRPLNHTGVRRAVGLLATPALALATFAALPAAPSYAVEADPIPATAGTSWLVGQLTDGLLDGACPFYCGRNIDAALGLEAAGVQPSVLDTMETAFEPFVDDYISWTYEASGGDIGGATAKTAVFAQLVEADPMYGGLNLITKLESLVSNEAGNEGRLFDTTDGVPDYAYANTLGQAFAVQALHTAGSVEAQAATEWLALQQCSEGFFREGFTAVGESDQTCDADAAAAPSTDATALALLMLQDQSANLNVQKVLTAGAAWLASTQYADGSWGSQPGSPGNANSTGLAGWALGELANPAAAADAAVWVRGVQADDPEPCVTGLTDQAGAIAFGPSEHGAARSDGITPAVLTQWQYATSQALPVLQWAPATGTGPVQTVTDNGFRRAGASVRVAADGIAPGDTVCIARSGDLEGLLTAGDNGQAVGRVVLPAGTGKRTYLLNNNESELSMLTFHALGAKKLGLGLSKTRIARGQVERVKVAKLVAGERVKVLFRGKVVRTGRADKSGVFATALKVTGRPGFANVKVVGQFANRANAKTLTVTR